MKFHSKANHVYRRPSFCGYCYDLASCMFTEYRGGFYSACCLDHLNKINRGEKLENKRKYAQINEEGITYSLAGAKEQYIDKARKNKSFELHKWEREDRITFVRALVQNYLDHAYHQAETGESKTWQT